MAGKPAVGQDGSVVSQASYQWQDLGYFQNNSLAAAQTLVQLAAAAVVPLSTTGIIGTYGTARAAVIYVEGAAIRWIADGQTPTATYGNEVGAGAGFVFSVDLTNLRIIGVSGGRHH
jgi:hypothetical protein